MHFDSFVPGAVSLLVHCRSQGCKCSPGKGSLSWKKNFAEDASNADLHLHLLISTKAWPKEWDTCRML